ncbi:MAG: sodium:calcium antiporter [Candidatus Gracilibacteria bacterium]|nr:sodium:calcium antiporter [Candidatus Gracilibacteria bacterium]
MSDIFGFLTAAALIFFAGKKLSYYGDLLAEMTGLGKAWIGLILMAGVTSLPELMVGISSSAIVQSADLAAGDILGSCLVNLGILAVMDAFLPKDKPLLANSSQSHVLAAALGLILIAIVGIGLFLPTEFNIGGIGVISVLFMIMYLGSMRLIYQYTKREQSDDIHDEIKEHKFTLRQVIIRYIGFASIIVGAALFLPHFAEKISIMTGLGQSFVGSIFLAISTSLPEIAISLAAIRMGSIDLSVGNLLGSNIFNVFILFIDDIFYTKGRFLSDVSDTNLITVFGIVIMSAIVIIGLTYKSKIKQLILAWDAVAIFLVYIATIVLLYSFT